MFSFDVGTDGLGKSAQDAERAMREAVEAANAQSWQSDDMLLAAAFLSECSNGPKAAAAAASALKPAYFSDRILRSWAVAARNRALDGFPCAGAENEIDAGPLTKAALGETLEALASELCRDGRSSSPALWLQALRRARNNAARLNACGKLAALLEYARTGPIRGGLFGSLKDAAMTALSEAEASLADESSYDEVMRDFFSALTTGELKDSERPSSTGFAGFDRALGGGALPGDLIVIGGRAGVGKTTAAINIAAAMSRSGKGCAAVSADMSPRDFSKWYLGSLLGVRPSDAMRLAAEASRRGDREFVDRASAALSAMSEGGSGRIVVMENPPRAPTVSDVAAFADLADEALKADGKRLDVLFIDYMQRIGADGDDGRATEAQRIEAVANALKDLATRKGVAVVALAQLNRGAAGEKPRVTHLRGSGGIEQAADAVFLLSDPDDDRGEDGERIGRSARDDGLKRIRVGVGKSRRGESGDAVEFFLDVAPSICRIYDDGSSTAPRADLERSKQGFAPKRAAPERAARRPAPPRAEPEGQDWAGDDPIEADWGDASRTRSAWADRGGGPRFGWPRI